MRRCATLACVLALTPAVLIAVCTGVASAAPAPPVLTITAPKEGGKTITTGTPTFRGTCQEFDASEYTPIKLNIYEGEVATGAPRVVPVTPGTGHTEWSVQLGEAEALSSGTYTVEAEQSALEGEVVGPPVKSKPVTFKIATGAPAVTITYPVNGSSSSGQSQLITGSSGSARGQVTSVNVEVFSGSTIPTPATPVTTATVTPSAGGWAVVLALGPGTYTARARARDETGNEGFSKPSTFTLTAPPSQPPLPPAASFTWLPATPVAGQQVALVSNSTDAFSPITSFAWDLAGNGPFRAAGPVLTTAFATPGNHAVRLLVSDALGATGMATATIPVSAAPLRLMQPFPIVRIGGVVTSGGVRLSSLTVQAPAGVLVTVSCKGHGCKTRQEGAAARATRHNRRGNAVLLSFPRFARSFLAGVTLEVRVMAAGEIGKYTRFVVRRHTVPSRTDACVAALDPRPIVCPA